MKQGRKVVVTGGAGFIGSNLVDELVLQGFAVTVVDGLSTGKIENVIKLVKDGNVELVEGSITELKLLQETFKGTDYVFHEAAIPSVPRSINSPLASHEVKRTISWKRTGWYLTNYSNVKLMARLTIKAGLWAG